MKRTKFDTRRLVLLSVLAGILLLLSFTPLGYLNIGPLAITLNMIPVAIGAAVLGPTAGLILGTLFGITSCMQCVGFGGFSAMGAAMFEIAPVLTILQRLLPRMVAGLVSGFVYMGSKKLFKSTAAGFITGFCAALLNTTLFMAALVLMFSHTDYLQNLIGGQNVFVFILTFVGINAVVEMLVSTLVVGAICKALNHTRFLGGQ